MRKKIKSVAVYCGHQFGKNPKYARDAKKIGELLAKNKITMVFGGSDAGLMGVTSNAVLENGGKIIGISTAHVVSLQEPLPKGINVKIVDGLSARKEEMFNLSDAFIILPGGIGTLDEMTDIMTKQQVGESRKPIYILNTANYWKAFGKLVHHVRAEEFINKRKDYTFDYNLHVMNTPEKIINALINNDNFIA